MSVCCSFCFKVSLQQPAEQTRAIASQTWVTFILPLGFHTSCDQCEFWSGARRDRHDMSPTPRHGDAPGTHRRCSCSAPHSCPSPPAIPHTNRAVTSWPWVRPHLVHDFGEGVDDLDDLALEDLCQVREVPDVAESGPRSTRSRFRVSVGQ
eukprot:1780944-Rhodomonas_salina.5